MDEQETTTGDGLQPLRTGGLWERFQAQIMRDREQRGEAPMKPGEDVIAERVAPREPAPVAEFKGYDALRRPDDVEHYECERCRDARYVTVGPPRLRELRACPKCNGGADVADPRGILAMRADPAKTLEAFDFERNAAMRDVWRLLDELIRGERWCVFIRAYTGTGKTHLSHAALIQWSKTWQSLDGAFVTVPELIDQFRMAFANGGTEMYDALAKSYRERDFLVLDDLGAQRPKDFADEELYKLIDARMRYKRRTVLSANIMPDTDEERERIDPRILSRISAGEIICRGLTDQRRELEV